ncbi:MAG: dicarboxylate/amino acid:cation symporter [Eubacterium sp.]|nr:dicarboxylate/amino acid:cation symporter [Eubacterium sp.]
MSERKKLSLATKIFIGLGLGIIAGLIFMKTGKTEWAVEYVKPFGTIFLNLIKFIVVPIVLTSIISGVISMKDIRKVGSIGWKTIAYYMTTTAFAVTIGLLGSNVFKGMYQVLSTSNLKYEAAEPTKITDTIVNIFPSNFINPMANAAMLQVIVIALLFGFGIILAGEKGKPFGGFIESASEVCMKVMEMIINLSPIGVFCLIVPVVAENGPQILGSLALVIAAAYICYIIHALVVYSASVKIMAGLSPVEFFKGVAPAMAMAFSSASSVGALPLNIECTEKMGARRDIASFVLPLGATINMDGTAIYQGVTAIFIARCFGIDLTIAQMLTIVLTATLASIGTAGVPGSGMIMLAMVLQSVGLPVEGIALVAGVDRIFDMGRTTVNITGDAACTMIVSRLEEKKEARLAANRSRA